MTNSIVQSWEKYQLRPKIAVDDGLVIDGKQVKFQETAKSEVKRMKNPNLKVSLNFGSVQELVLYGPQTQIETLFVETHRTMARLRLRVGRIQPFTGGTRFEGGRPNNHDILRWLDDLEVDEKYALDIQFLRRMHKTLLSRVHPEVIKQVKSGQVSKAIV